MIIMIMNKKSERYHYGMIPTISIHLRSAEHVLHSHTKQYLKHVHFAPAFVLMTIFKFIIFFLSISYVYMFCPICSQIRRLFVAFCGQYSSLIFMFSILAQIIYCYNQMGKNSHLKWWYLNMLTHDSHQTITLKCHWIFTNDYQFV